MVASIGRDIAFRATITDDTKRGAESAKRTIRDTARQVAKEHGEGGGHFGRVFSDASTTGLDTLSRGLLGGISEKLGTGLQIGTLAVVSATLNRMAKGGEEYAAALRKGGAAAEAAKWSLLEQIPIYGSIISAGRSIREFFTGEKAAIEDIKQLTKDIEDADQRNLVTSLAIVDAKRANANEVARINREIGGVHLRGNQADVYGINSDTAAERNQSTADVEKLKHDAASDADSKAAQAAYAKFIDDGKLNRISTLQAQMKTDPNDRKFFGYNKAELQRLQDEQDRLRFNMRRASENKEAKLSEGIAHRKETAKLNEAKNDERVQESINRHQEQFFDDQQEAVDKNRQMDDESAASALRTAGHIADAKKKEIDARYDADIRQAGLDTDRKKQQTTDQNEQNELDRQFGSLTASINQKRQADLAQADKEAGVERKRIAYDAGQAIADADAAGNAQRLRESGEGYQARKALDQREHEKRLADIDQRAKEEITQNADNAGEINRKAKAEKDKENADFKERQRQAGEDRRRGEFSTALELSNGAVDALKAEARMGNIAAATDAKRLEIANKFAEKKEHLNEIIKDPKVNEAERNLARSQLAGLAAQENREKLLAGFTGGASMPSLVMAGRVSGAALRATEEASPFIALTRYAKEQGKTLTDISTYTEKMAKVFSENPQIAALFNFKPGR